MKIARTIVSWLARLNPVRWAGPGDWIAFVISVAALAVAWRSWQESTKATKIAATALTESQRQYLAANKPIIVATPSRASENGDYFELGRHEGGRLTVTTMVSLDNTGSIIAGNVFIRSVSARLLYGGEEVASLEQDMKPLNAHDNLSLLSIPPGRSVNKVINLRFPLDTQDARLLVSKDRISLSLNLLIYYYSRSIQIPNAAAEEQLYCTNVAHRLFRQSYTTGMQTFLDKPLLGIEGRPTPRPE